MVEKVSQDGTSAIKLRLRFAKQGRSIYISHLDLMRTMQRAFLRASVPLKYSEGFNPHPVISILLPLGVGVSSVCELMDFQLTEALPLAELPQRLNAVLPEGITASEVYSGGRKVRELKWLRVSGEWEYDNRGTENLSPLLNEFFHRPSLIIEKKTKRGRSESDIIPAIREISFFPTPEGNLKVEAILSAQEPTLNPDHLVSALRQLFPALAPDFAEFRRLEVYDTEMHTFR